MAKADLPSPELLRKLLRYDPESGKLYWLERGVSFFPDDRVMKIWNTRFSNREAFCTLDTKGYYEGRVLTGRYRAHRVAWAIHYGEWPDGEIDHIDGVRTNNRISNLRVVTASQNSANKRMLSNNKSGVNGVWWSSRDNRWVAQIQYCGQRRYIGSFCSLESAKEARKQAESVLGFHPNHGRV